MMSRLGLGLADPNPNPNPNPSPDLVGGGGRVKPHGSGQPARQAKVAAHLLRAGARVSRVGGKGREGQREGSVRRAGWEGEWVRVGLRVRLGAQPTRILLG